MTTITPSTSVVLVDTTTGLSPYIIYFPYIPTVGRIITVRDNSGYVSTNNTILLSTQSGVYFQDNQSTLTINQPYGYITLSVQPNGIYSILNTFAFPTESSAAYVFNVNTTKLGIEDPNTNILSYVTVSTGSLYYNSTIVGDVTNTILQSNLNNIQNDFTNKINSTTVVRRYIAVGNNNTPNTIDGSIQYSDNSLVWNDSIGGFSNGGNDIYANSELWVACGNNYDSLNPNNNGFLQWSTDGITWNNSSNILSVSTIRKKIYYANGLWHAVGEGSNISTILWSSDGKSWKPSVNSAFIFDTLGFNSITYGRNLWVACGNNSNNPAYSLIYSSNGSNWYPNTTINPTLRPFYDVVYTGNTFVALNSNSGTGGNILVTVSGSNDSTIIPVDFNDEPGYLATNENILLAVTNTYHRYSLDYGYTWATMPDFPSGTPGRPFYDGSLWWVGISSITSSNLYYSTSGSNLWKSSNLTNVFPTGYPVALVSINSSSNLGLQLISTVSGLQTIFQTSNLISNNINIGDFNIFNSSGVLYISSIDNTDSVYINNISTNFITADSIYTNTIEITDFNASTLNISTLFASDVIYSSSLSVSSITADYTSVDILYFNTLGMTTMYIDNISTTTINVDTISSGVAYIDTVSSTSLVVSTINLIDTLTGTLTDLIANNNSLLFQGEKLLTTLGTNPLLFAYQLQDITNAPPDPTFFSVDNADLRSITKINLSALDYNNKLLSGLFSKVGIYSIFHIIKQTTSQDSIFLITSITDNGTDYTFELDHLVGLSTPLNPGPPGDIYNFFITNIGIKPPPSSPTDTIIVKAGISGTTFDFNSAFTVVPINIGTYVYGSTGFTINLNDTNYNSGNIPATVGSISFFDGSKYIQTNVKYGSISAGTGAYVTVDGGVNNLIISGLTPGNFTGADNDGNGYAIYITIKLLN